MPAPVAILRLPFPCFERKPFFVGLDCGSFQLLPDPQKYRGDVGENSPPDPIKGALGDGGSLPVPRHPRYIYDITGCVRRGRTGKQSSDRPVILLPDGENDGAAPVTVEPPLYADVGGRDKAERLHNLKAALTEVRAVLAEAAGNHAALMAQLAESDGEQATLKSALRQTHGLVWGRPDYWPGERRAIERVLFSQVPESRDARRNYYGRLLNLAAKWGGLREERRRVGAWVKSLQREARQIAREIERLSKPKRKAA